MSWQKYLHRGFLLLLLTAPVHSVFAQQENTTDPAAFEKQVGQLQFTVKRLMDINAELSGDSVWDREALVYRRDALTLKALALMDGVARALPGLDPESDLLQLWDE